MSIMQDEEMEAEALDAKEDATAEQVQRLYRNLKDMGWLYEDIIKYIAEEYQVDAVRYLRVEDVQ